MSSQWKKQWEVASHTSDSVYTVSMRDDGTMACSCASWKFHKAPKIDCKHCLAIRMQESPEQLIPPTPKALEVIKRAIQHTPSAAGMLTINTGRRIYLEDEP